VQPLLVMESSWRVKSLVLVAGVECGLFSLFKEITEINGSAC